MLDFRNKQAEIKNRAAKAIADYPGLWSRMIRNWKDGTGADRAYLTYSANYLFRTAGIGWAIDPFFLYHRFDIPHTINIAEDLATLSFVILTHEHNDHLDGELIRALRESPLRWIVPQALIPLVKNQLGIPESRIITPVNMNPIELENITVVPFEGMHWETVWRGGSETSKGVPATAYFVEFNHKRWLFPGDVRTYDMDALPGFGTLDGVFAHLWLGRKSGLMDSPPLVDAFCEFYSSLHPKRIVITHLNEIGRNAYDYWDERHYKIVQDRLNTTTPEITVTSAIIGDEVIF